MKVKRNKSKRKSKYVKIGKIILLTIAGVGMLSMAVAAPNALQSLDMFYGSNKKRSRYYKYYINNSISRLIDKKLIEFCKKDGKKFLRLTDKGKKEVLKYKLQEKLIKRPWIWDRKWRVIIFDIKERDRRIRDSLRKMLAGLGFVRLQNSVWIFPFECEEVIIMLKANYKLGKNVLYMKVEKVENDKWLRKKFSL